MPVCHRLGMLLKGKGPETLRHQMIEISRIYELISTRCRFLDPSETSYQELIGTAMRPDFARTSTLFK
jgi:hypothetical protein